MNRICLSTLALLLTGCATQYVHTTITDSKQAARQLDIDTGRCTAVASQSVPVPQPVAGINPALLGGQTTRMQGRFSDGTTYTGTMTTEPNYAAQGYAIGANMGPGLRAQREKDAIFHGCMVSLGWEKNNHQSSPPITTKTKDAINYGEGDMPAQ
ncbi:MAG: hypothetical protein ABL896_01670 [Hylemonella sp.]